MRKKGFTLIEIIVCIALIAVIGTVSVVSVSKVMNSNGEKNILEKNASNFKDALEVYLSEHTEIIENVNNNAKAAVVSLELLKNEGLISKDLDIDYKNNYFTLSNAILMPPDGSVDECADQIEIKTFASWELDDKSTEVLYICPRENDEEQENPQDEVDELLERIESLELSLSLLDLGGKNYILFDVNSNLNNITSWPDGNNQDLWAIIKANTVDKELKLLYNQNLITDNSKGYESEGIIYSSTALCDTFYSKNSLKDRYKLTMDNSKVKYWDLDKNSYSGSTEADAIIDYDEKTYLVKVYNGKKCHRVSELTVRDNYIYRKHKYYNQFVNYDYSYDDAGWSYDEIITDKYNTQNSKKAMLYNSINSQIRPFIKEKPYKYVYQASKSCVSSSSVLSSIDVKANYTYKDIFGTVDKTDDIEEVLNSFTGLKFFVGRSTYNFLSGTSCKYAFNFRELSNGTTWGAGAGYFWSDNSGARIDFNTTNLTNTSTLIGGKELQNIMTTNYVPVITISFNNILNNIADYPQKYKEIYPDCSSGDLGTKSCPKIVKFSDGTLSWEN